MQTFAGSFLPGLYFISQLRYKNRIDWARSSTFVCGVDIDIDIDIDIDWSHFNGAGLARRHLARDSHDGARCRKERVPRRLVTVLIRPLIALLLVGNFLGQCLTWQARFPKDIEHAGQDA